MFSLELCAETATFRSSVQRCRKGVRRFHNPWGPTDTGGWVAVKVGGVGLSWETPEEGLHHQGDHQGSKRGQRSKWNLWERLSSTIGVGGGQPPFPVTWIQASKPPICSKSCLHWTYEDAVNSVFPDTRLVPKVLEVLDDHLQVREGMFWAIPGEIMQCFHPKWSQMVNKYCGVTPNMVIVILRPHLQSQIIMQVKDFWDQPRTRWFDQIEPSWLLTQNYTKWHWESTWRSVVICWNLGHSLHCMGRKSKVYSTQALSRCVWEWHWLVLLDLQSSACSYQERSNCVVWSELGEPTILRGLQQELLEVSVPCGAEVEVPHHSGSHYWVSHSPLLKCCFLILFPNHILFWEGQDISGESIHLAEKEGEIPVTQLLGPQGGRETARASKNSVIFFIGNCYIWLFSILWIFMVKLCIHMKNSYWGHHPQVGEECGMTHLTDC